MESEQAIDKGPPPQTLYSVSLSLSAVVHTCILLTAKQYLIKKLLHEEHGITTYKRAFPHLSFISEKRVLVKSSESSFADLPSFSPSLHHPPPSLPTPECLFNLILPRSLSLSLYICLLSLLRPLFIVLLLHSNSFFLFFPYFFHFGLLRLCLLILRKIL